MLTLTNPFFLRLLHLQGDAVYLKKSIQDEAVLPLTLSRHGDETPRHISSSASDRTQASDW